jgi:uncharacterized membrane protein YkoI
MKRTLQNFPALGFAAVLALGLWAVLPQPLGALGAVNASEIGKATLYALLDDHDDALKAIKRGEVMSYSQIKRAVQDKLGGRVVDIKLRRTNRGWQYFLRLSRSSGRVVAAVVDAKTGRILSTK